MFLPPVDGPTELPSDDDPWSKWLGGVVLPLLLAAGGIAILSASEIVIPWRGQQAVFRGPTIIAIGLMPITCALWLHCWNFWSRSPTLAPFVPIGLVAAVALFVGCVFYVLVRSFAL